jgi:hypothetical protein
MKTRLFVLGDSFAFNLFDIEKLSKWHYLWSTYMAKHNQLYEREPRHWTEYFENQFDIYNFSSPGQCNESIIYQLGNLPDFQEGDRLIIIFSDLGRFRRTNVFEDALPRPVDYLINYQYDSQTAVIEEIINERFQSLATKNRDDEKLFYTWLQRNLKEYKPIFLHWPDWSEQYQLFSIQHQLQYRTIKEETNDEINDLHPGVYSNYLMYRQISYLLGHEPNQDYVNKLK